MRGLPDHPSHEPQFRDMRRLYDEQSAHPVKLRYDTEAFFIET